MPTSRAQLERDRAAAPDPQEAEDEAAEDQAEEAAADAEAEAHKS